MSDNGADNANVTVLPAVRDASLGVPARYGFEKEQRLAIRATVAKDCNDHEFVMLLELAARYELDPFARQIWAAKMSGANGPVSILIGRDGLLAIADRNPDFRGMRAAAVHENDSLVLDRVTRPGDGTERIDVAHTWPGGSLKRDARGELVAAFAIVRREGRDDTLFIAYLDEYVPANIENMRRSPWQRQREGMLIKCAQSNALRVAYSISGFVPDEETQANRALDTTAAPAEPVYDDGPDGEWLRALVAEANRMRPGSYRPAKLAALMGASDFEFEALAASLVAFIGQHGGDAPARPEEPVDAEVVA